MNYGKLALVTILILAVAGIIYIKERRGKETKTPDKTSVASQPVAPPADSDPKPAVTPMVRGHEKPKLTVKPVKNNNPAETQKIPAVTKAPPPVPAKLPRLLELGADKCVPCKMMQPVLDELRQAYAGKLQVDFIDVWKNPKAERQYNVVGIPTQIFFDSGGKELFRHVGFYPREDIEAKFKELGIKL